MQGSKEARSAFVVACGDGTEVLEATEKAFNLVALRVNFCIVRTTAALVYLAGDRRLDTAAAQEGPKGARAVGFVGSEAFGSKSRPTTAAGVDAALAHKLLSDGAVVLLSRCQQ